MFKLFKSTKPAYVQATANDNSNRVTLDPTFVRAALQHDLWNGGSNERTRAVIASCCRTPRDKEVVSCAVRFMEEIYNIRRSSNGESWTWRHENPDFDFNESEIICEIAGCWLDGDYNFYVNQNHDDWASW